jgi:hypothetical protein
MPHKFYHVTNTGSQQYRISYNHSERIAATEGKLLFAQPSDIASRIYFSPGRADNDLLSKYLQRKGRDIILDLQEARKGMQGDRRKLTLLGNYATYTPAASGATQEYKQQDQRASATFRVELDLGDIASSAAPASSSAQVLPAQASPASSTQAPTAPAPITQARTFQAPTAYTPTPAKAQAPLPDLLQELPTATPRAAVISPYTLLAQIPSAPTKVSQAEVLAHPATNQAAPAANPENYAERNSTETRAAAQTKAVVETRATTDVATRLQNTPETQKANLEKSISELQRAPAVQPQYLPSARSIEMLAAITPALTYTTITPRAPAAAAAPTIATVAAAPIGSPASFKLVQKYFINAPAPNTMQPWSLKRLRYGEESLRESPFVFAEISERSPWTGNSYGAGNMFSTSQSAIYAWNPDAPMQLAQSRVQVMQRTTHGKILYRPTFRGYRILPQDWLQQQTPQRFRFQSVRETYGI